MGKDESQILNYLINKRVKAVFKDGDRVKVVKGILREANENYIVVDDVIIGLGNSFISCIPQEEGIT